MNITEKEFKEFIEQAHMAGQHNQGHCDPSYYEAMAYYENTVKKQISPSTDNLTETKEICYKTNSPCEYNCKGLCKDSF